MSLFYVTYYSLFVCLFVCLFVRASSPKQYGVQGSNSVGGWSLVQPRFYEYFLVSCYYWSSLHEFLWFVRACYVALGSNLADGWSLGWLCFCSNLLASFHDKSFLHKFLFFSFFFFFFFFFFWLASLHKAQTRCAGGAWSNLDYLNNILAICF